MRYRKLSPTGDYTFGSQQNDFYRDQPEAVGQAVRTRLELRLGEWWLDVTDGTPHQTQILGAHTQGTRDPALTARILLTQGVTLLDNYNSVLTPERNLLVGGTVTTVYGETEIVGTL